MPNKDYSDIIKRLKSEDLTAFDEIYALTKKAVYYTAYSVFKSKEVAEDIMQETYLALLEKKNKLREDLDLPAYLVTMAKNASYDLYMKRKRENELDEGVGVDTVFDPGPDSGLISRIKELLSPKEFEIFILRALGEYSFKEISKMKGIPVGTLTWSYQEARKKLSAALGERI